jgi:Zn-dependent protease with chaperone function
MKFLFFLALATLSFAQQADTRLDNYYSLQMEAELGDRFIKQLQTNITAVPEPRLDRICSRLASSNSQFHFRIFVFDGGQPSPDEAPAAAFPADWRRLKLDEAIAVAGGSIFVPRALLSQDDQHLSAIIAHAMGHVALRHATVGLTRGELAQVEVQIAARSLPEEAPKLVQTVADKRFAFDCACEIAADEYAVKILHTAGLDPATLLEYLRTLPAPPENNEFVVYPSPATRVQAVQAAIANIPR